MESRPPEPRTTIAPSPAIDLGLAPHDAAEGAQELAQAKTVISKGKPSSLPLRPSPHGTPAEIARVLEGHALDHFQLESLIGGGGMGAVFRARDARLDRIVAVKVMPRVGEDTELLRRFRNEAQSAARLDHPNIARVYDVGEHEGWYYIVFEFIEGTNLRDLVLRDGPLQIDDAVYFTRQVAEALEHASRRGVTHRDIKPSNVLITPSGLVKLVDMGLARAQQLEMSGEMTASGVTLGTFDYISPEQAKDPRDADVRSDIYSLGCTLYFTLVGRAPYEGGTPLQKLLNHGSAPLPDPRAVRPGLSENLVAVLRKMMAKDPAARYRRPLDLIADLYQLAQRERLPKSLSAGSVTLVPESRFLHLLELHLPWIAAASLVLISVAWLQILSSTGNDLPLSEPPPAVVFPVPESPPAPEPRDLDSNATDRPSSARPNRNSNPALPGPAENLSSAEAAPGSPSPERSGPSRESAEPQSPSDLPLGPEKDLSDEARMPPKLVPGEAIDPDDLPLTTTGPPAINVPSASGLAPETGLPGPSSSPSSSPKLPNSENSQDASTEPSASASSASGLGGIREESPRGPSSQSPLTIGPLTSGPLEMGSLATGPRAVRVVGADDDRTTLSSTPERTILPSFQAALAMAREDPRIEVIEIAGPTTHSGSLALPSRALRIRGLGPESVLSFQSPARERDVAAEASRLVLMELRGGSSLVIENLHLHWKCPPDLVGGGTLLGLAASQPGTQLSLENSLLTIENPTRVADVFAFEALTDENSTTTVTTPAALNLRNVVIRGQMTMLSFRKAVNFDFRWDDGLLAIDGQMIRIPGGTSVPPTLPPQLRITFSDVTAAASEGLIAVRLSPEANHPVLVDRQAVRSLFTIPGNRPLMTLEGIVPSGSVDQYFLLRGADNSYDAADGRTQTILRATTTSSREVTFSIRDLLAPERPAWIQESGVRDAVAWRNAPLPTRNHHLFGATEYLQASGQRGGFRAMNFPEFSSPGSN